MFTWRYRHESIYHCKHTVIKELLRNHAEIDRATAHDDGALFPCSVCRQRLALFSTLGSSFTTSSPLRLDSGFRWWGTCVKESSWRRWRSVSTTLCLLSTSSLPMRCSWMTSGPNATNCVKSWSVSKHVLQLWKYYSNAALSAALFFWSCRKRLAA